MPLTAAEVVNAKRQSGKVRELMIARPYQTVFHALKTMQEQDISQIPVFEEDLPIGTIYEDQILTLALQGKDLRKLVVREVMSKPLPRIPAMLRRSNASRTFSATKIPRYSWSWMKRDSKSSPSTT